MLKTWDDETLKRMIKKTAGSQTTTISKIWENNDPTFFQKQTILITNLKDYKNLIITYLENARSATSIINIILKIDSNTIRKIKKVISFPIDGGQMVRTVDIEPLIGNIIISDCIVYNYHDNTQEIDNEKLIPFEIFGY